VISFHKQQNVANLHRSVSKHWALVFHHWNCSALAFLRFCLCFDRGRARKSCGEMASNPAKAP